MSTNEHDAGAEPLTDAELDHLDALNRARTPGRLDVLPWPGDGEGYQVCEVDNLIVRSRCAQRAPAADDARTSASRAGSAFSAAAMARASRAAAAALASDDGPRLHIPRDLLAGSGGLTRAMPLSRPAEQHLVALTRAGDARAASALLRSLDGLLRRAAWPYRDAGHGMGIGFDDYLQEARLEVVASCQSYDPSRGALFRSYAMVRVRWRMSHIQRDGLRDASREQEVAPFAAPEEAPDAAAQLEAARLDAAVARALSSAVSAAVAGRDRRIVRARLVTLHTGVERRSARDVGTALGCSHQHVHNVEDAALAFMRMRLGVSAG